MTTLELFEKYGRRFALCDFGDNGYFDFFEIKAVKNEPPIIKNVKIMLYGKEDILISEQPDLEIYDLELVLQNYSFHETVNLAGEDKISKLLRDFRADCDRLYPMLLENKISDEFFEIKNRALKTAKAIEKYFEPEPPKPRKSKFRFLK